MANEINIPAGNTITIINNHSDKKKKTKHENFTMLFHETIQWLIEEKQISGLQARILLLLSYSVDWDGDTKLTQAEIMRRLSYKWKNNMIAELKQLEEYGVIYLQKQGRTNIISVNKEFINKGTAAQ